jgi:thiamine pyrophosphate-dependent acetolactate synthase large subunit-like protein
MVTGIRPSRADYYRVLAGAVPANALVITALGNASYLWAAMRHAPENFYIEDAMGLALPLALGLAVAQTTRRVLVIEGDGGVMMHMGALIIVGAVAPKNLTVLLIQNGVRAASGGQVLTNPVLDFTQIARSASIGHAENVATPKAFAAALRGAFAADGPEVLVLSTEPDLDLVRPPIVFDPVATKHRFMAAIEAPHYVPIMFGGSRLEGDQRQPRAPRGKSRRRQA